MNSRNPTWLKSGFVFDGAQDMFSKLLRLYRCSRHVPLPQLLRRMELNLKRRMMVSPLRRVLISQSSGSPGVRDRIPSAVFKPRRHLVQHSNDGLFLCHLGRKFSLQSPVDWMLEGTPHTHLERLALHYHEFLECVPFHDGQRLILDWIAANPPWQPGYWLDRWNSYAISIRCVCWMQWFAEHSSQLNEQDGTTILGSIAAQVRFLVQNLETDICGNHLIKNIRCLMWAGAFFEGPESAQWSKLAEDLLRWQLPIQFLEDGLHFELSPAYHCQVFGDLLECLAVASDLIRAELLNILNRAAQVMVDLTHPDGLISLMSDGGLHMVYSPSEYLEAFEQQGGTKPLPQNNFAFRNSGYYGFRSKRSYLLFDCGPACADSLPAHGHADILSIEWDVDGQRLFVDAGVYQYEAGRERTRFKSVASHNTVQVGDRDQVEFVGSFRVGRRAHGECDRHEASAGRFFIEGHHSGFSTHHDEVKHSRRITASDASLRIDDSIEGSSSENAVSRFLLHDSCSVIELGDGKLELRRGDTRVRFTSNSPYRVVDSAWSPDFGELVPTKCLELLLGRIPYQSEVCLEVL